MSKSTTPEVPATPEPTFVLSLPVLVTIIDEVKALDARIGETLGTIGKIMADARTAIDSSPVVDEFAASLPTMLSLTPETTWTEFLSALDTYRTDIDSAYATAIVAQAGDTQVTHKATVEALQSERDAKFGVAQSMHTMLTQMAAMFPGIEKVSLPTKGRTSAGATSGTPKTLGGGSAVSVYKVKDDGTRYFYAKGSPLGLVALRVFDSTAEALRAHLNSIGVDSTAPFEPVKVTLNDKTATIGGASGEVATETK